MVEQRTLKIKDAAGETLSDGIRKTMSLGNYIQISGIRTEGEGGTKATKIYNC